jgi:uncharacterized protein (DUF427 family)
LVYFFPPEDVRHDYLVAVDASSQGSEGAGKLWTVEVADRRIERAAWSHTGASPDRIDLEGYVGFKWDLIDAWFEEDEQVYVHPRDPYTRIDVLHSSREVKVVVEGETIMETVRPTILLETALPARFYFPRDDVRLDLLVPSDNQTRCPYKGTASYYSVEVGDTVLEDIMWYYPFPHPEMFKIQNLVSIYHERLDGFYLDGERITPASEE